MYTKIPRYIAYIIHYKDSIKYIVILDIWNKRRMLISDISHNNRPTKKFTPKLIKKLVTYTFISIRYFTKALQDEICWDAEVDMSKLMSMIKNWEKLICTGQIEKITRLQIIP